MRCFLFIFATLFLTPFALAELDILETSEKSVHVALDQVKDYKLGDVINFYENKKLVAQGKISYLTPQKTKAVVTHFKGKPFQSNYMARVQYVNRYIQQRAGREMAQAARQQREVMPQLQKQVQPQRKPASIATTRPAPMQSSFGGKTTQDLLFYPEAHSFYLQMGGGYVKSKLKIENAYEANNDLKLIYSNLLYSPLQDLNFGLGIAYGSGTVEVNSSSDSYSGLADPRIYLNYQIISSQEKNMQWVLGLEISPSIGKEDDDTYVRGNTLVSLMSYFGMKHGAFSWALAPRIKYYTETKSKNSVDEKDSYYALLLELEAQYDINQRWAIYAPFLISYTGDQKASDGTYTFESYASFGAGLGFKFAVSESTNFFFSGRYEISPTRNITTILPSTHAGEESGFLIDLGMNFKF